WPFLVIYYLSLHDALPIFVVHRVDDAPAADALQARLDDLGLGGVQHDRQGRGGGEQGGQLGHVRDTVAADEVDAQVDHVRAFAGDRKSTRLNSSHVKNSYA